MAKRKNGSSDIVGTAIVYLGIAVVLFALVWALWSVAMFIQPHLRAPQQQTYESVYNQCMTRELFTHEQCHDIALSTAYPAGIR